MKNIFRFILFAIMLSWNNIYSQGGSDIIFCLDNSGSIDSTEFAGMSQSARDIMQAVLRCNPQNRVSVVHYGTYFPTASTVEPKIYIESDFTNNIGTATTFQRRLNAGDHFHEATGLIGNALDNISNPNIVSPQTTLNTISPRPLTIFLFTDALRGAGDLSNGSFLVRYGNPPPAIGNNIAFTNFTNFKNNRNAKFVVVQVSTNSIDIAAAAGIASFGGNYTGPNLESYSADPNNGQFPRLYLNKTNFVLTSSEINTITNNICAISNGTVNFSYKSAECGDIIYPINIYGNYSIPSGTTITSFQISLINTTTGTIYPVNSVVSYPSANNFHFSINQSDFTNPLSGEYKFLVTLTYSNGGSSQTISANNSLTGAPFDLKFCCPNDLYIDTDVIAPNTDFQQASNSITAVNVIENGATAVYHAGTFVSLQEGFNAKTGSNFHAYIEGCNTDSNLINKNNEDYSFDPNADPNNMKSLLQENNKQKINYISPNPNNGQFKIVLNKVTSGSIKILDMNSKTVFEKLFKNEKEVPVNIQTQPSAVYIIKVVSGNDVFTGKIIKR